MSLPRVKNHSWEEPVRNASTSRTRRLAALACLPEATLRSPLALLHLRGAHIDAPPSATSEGAINRQDGTRPGGAFRHDRRSEPWHTLAIRMYRARTLPASFWRLPKL